MIDRANNFDTLRFIAALAVLWSHAFSVSMGTGRKEPLVLLSGGQTTLGTVAVAIFFIISGYLVTQSFVRSSSAWRFAKARTLRLMPGLLTVLLLLGLVIGPLVTALPLAEYFGSPQVYRYMFLNGSLLGYDARLPGVFEDNPRPYVNNPLWTLRFEAYCYVLVFALGVLGLLNRYVTLALFLGGFTYIALDGPYVIYEFEGQVATYDFNEWNHHVDLTTKFLAGAVLYHWRPRLSTVAAAVCAAVTLWALLAGGFWLALPTVFAYVVIYVALAPFRLPNLARYGDLSYGIYIYGWPVKQLVLHFGLASTWYGVGSFATVISIGLAFLSWHLVEKVALSYKDRPLPGERRLKDYVDSLMTPLGTAATPPTPKTDEK
jgi:peptidoglycan/LPS O-acetylase OafA/YrhL